MELIVKFIIKDDGNNNNLYLSSLSDLVSKQFLSINNHYLNSLSLVSKQFFSITNRLLFSLTLYDESPCGRLFERFTNINSLKLRGNNIDKLLLQISRSQLKPTSLSIPYIPANALRTFSQKNTTLTSLKCSKINILTDLSLIVECFPLLEELDLNDASINWQQLDRRYLDDGIEALSLALIKLRKVNLSAVPINNQSLFHLFNNCKYLEEVILFWCDEITDVALASALRERPTLRSLSFSTLEPTKVFPTSQLIDSLVSLKGLTCLVLPFLNISDELLYSIAREGLPLTSLNLRFCTNYSYNGIFYLLSKCQRIKHLNLEDARFLDDEHVVQLSVFLRDLVSINLSQCCKLKEALFTLARNCPSLSEIKMEWNGSMSVQNSDSLVEFGVYPQLKSLYLGNSSGLSDEIITMFPSIFPNLELLDLYYCKGISEVPKLEVLNLSNTNVNDETLYVISKSCCGLLQLLLKDCYGVTEKAVKYVAENCTKLREISVEGCSRVKLLGMNFVVPKLEVLNLSDTDVDDETHYMISKNCSGLMKLSLYNCNGVTEKG
ncbi:F-box/LRR-repeat protein [Trifolium medium]|uniref:F-box/LRR-repeat protein n=1 Tax=Trifolium medium TaxID=97028 RepID=A0A392LZ75_9FABA|nr:F-box/LRR-repeat protein [Trifolium medium]